MTKRKYVRKRPHNTLTKKNIREMKAMLADRIPKSRIAKAMGISRRHLYRIVERYWPELTE